jgi:hypothetical protein
MALILKEVRLCVLKDAPNAFGSTYHDESQLPDVEWQRRAFAMSASAQ